MKRINRARAKKSISRKEYRYNAWDHDIDWDYGWDAKPNYRSGFKQSNKLIWQCEYRKWRSWKYNRKTQYK